MSQAFELPVADVEAAAGPSAEDVQTVRDLAERATSLSDEVGAMEAELTRRKNELKGIVERDLPNAMAAARLEAWPMRGGASFQLTTITNASIPKDAYDEGLAWLERAGHGDMIKRKFTIQFGRDELAWAKKFMQDCLKRKKPLRIERKDWVEPQTLSAFAREQLRVAAAEGRDPEELAPTKVLGVFQMTFAKFVEPKTKASSR